MSTPEEDLALLFDLTPKPFKDVESLFRMVQTALETWGKAQVSKAVVRVGYKLTPEFEVFEDARPGWDLVAKVDGYGDLNVDAKADRVVLTEVDPLPLFSKEWAAKGATLEAAAEGIRKQVTDALEDVLNQRRADVATTEQTLRALREGLTPEDLWGDSMKAEKQLETIAEEGYTSPQSPVTHHLQEGD